MASQQLQYIPQSPSHFQVGNNQDNNTEQNPATNQENPKISIRFPKIHKGFGIVFLVIGSLIIIPEIVGIALISPYYGKTYQNISTHPVTANNYDDQKIIIVSFGTGIWSGIFFLITGLLQYLTSIKHSRGYLMTALSLDILTCVVAFLGFSLAALSSGIYDIDLYNSVSGYKEVAKYSIAKDYLVVICNVLIAIFTIVHAGFVCNETAVSCCKKNTSQVPGVIYVVPQAGQLAQGSNTPSGISQMAPHYPGVINYAQGSNIPYSISQMVPHYPGVTNYAQGSNIPYSISQMVPHSSGVPNYGGGSNTSHGISQSAASYASVNNHIHNANVPYVISKPENPLYIPSATKYLKEEYQTAELIRRQIIMDPLPFDNSNSEVIKTPRR